MISPEVLRTVTAISPRSPRDIVPWSELSWQRAGTEHSKRQVSAATNHWAQRSELGSLPRLMSPPEPFAKVVRTIGCVKRNVYAYFGSIWGERLHEFHAREIELTLSSAFTTMVRELENFVFVALRIRSDSFAKRL